MVPLGHNAKRTQMSQNIFSETVRRDDAVFKVIVHPSPEASAIIVNYPGYKGDINGFNNKYRTIGEHLSRAGVGAFIQMPNIVWPDQDYRTSLIADLLKVCEYARAKAPAICKSATPDLLLMGFSAGGGAVAGAALKSGAKKILLIAPSGDAAQDKVTASLAKYTGEVFITIGENDDTVGGERTGKAYLDMAKSARSKLLVVVPNCDHQFRGTENGKIMSKAPLWAFAGDTTFPSPDGGLILY